MGLGYKGFIPGGLYAKQAPYPLYYPADMWSLIHFKLPIVYGIRHGPNFIFLHVAILFSPEPFIEEVNEVYHSPLCHK